MKRDKNNPEKVNEVLIKYLTGSASPEERELAIQWINEYPQNQKYFDELKAYYQLTKIVQMPSGYSKEEGWKRIKDGYVKRFHDKESSSIKNNNSKKLFFIRASLVAAVFIAFFLGFYLNKLSPSIRVLKPSLVYNEIVVPLGAKSQVTLSDGSKIWINAGSKLKYPANMNSKEVVVFLDGEAYFDVTKNQNRRFVVNTSKIGISVLGTRFNVKSYQNDKTVETTLEKGKISITGSLNNYDASPIILMPNQKATFIKSSEKIEIVNFNSGNQNKYPSDSLQKVSGNTAITTVPLETKVYTSWKDGKLIFNSERFEDLALQMERWYNVQIFIEDNDLKNLRFTGVFEKETVEQSIKALSFTSSFRYKIDKNRITIKKIKLH